MSIFDESIVTNIKLKDRFDMRYLSFGEQNEISISVNGNPLVYFGNKNWGFPVWYQERLEPNTFVGKMGDTIMPPAEVEYHFGPGGFSCTCDGTRVHITRENFFKRQYMNMYHIPFFQILFGDALRFGEVDQLFTPENFGSQSNIYTWSGDRGNAYSEFWFEWGKIFSRAMSDLIRPEYNVAINHSVSQSYINHCYFWFRISFLSINGNPCQWWYNDKSKINWAWGSAPDPLNTYPSFDIFFEAVFKK